MSSPSRLGKCTAASAALILSACLTACGSDAGRASSTVTETVTETVTAAAEPAPEPATSSASTAAAVSDVGKPIDNNGAIVTVKKVRSTKSIELDGSNREAQSGGRFVVVSTTVKNKTNASMDLTCGLPISTHLIDAAGAEYDPIEDLYKVSRNPECNASLNPGFQTKMTWIFEAPTDVQVAGMSILESNMYRDPSEATTISFTV